MNVRRHLTACFGAAILLLAGAVPAAQASFGINGLSVTAYNEDHSVDLQAGSHPYEYTLKFNTNQDEEGRPEGRVRDIFVDLPPGLIGNPQSLPRCIRHDFVGILPRCPGNTQVGVATVFVKNLGALINLGVYNLTPSPGVPATLGFTVDNRNSFQEASVRTEGDYGVTVRDITLPTEIGIQSVEETIWGVPMDRGHDLNRLCVNPINRDGDLIEGCSSDALPAPFLTLPTSCLGPLKTTVRVDSLEEPGEFVEESTSSVEDGGHLAGLTGCDRPTFDPKVTVQPETSASDSPTGLHVNLHIPQNADPAGLATANLKDTQVILPTGLVVNPSAADGLDACSSQQVDLHGSGPANCPAASRVGAVAVGTPLVDHPLPGSVFLAKQGDNPFNSLLALYVVVDDAQTGVIVKLAGRVEPDPVTGQLRATFLENPQLPFEDFTLDFFGGPRATLTTPTTCGTYSTSADLTPWTSPEHGHALLEDSFAITGSPSGGVCAPSEAQMPNAASFEAGTKTPLAGSFSPFVARLSRENGSQHVAALNMTLPPGVSAKLAGVARCSEAQVAQARARANPGEGALENAAPSCPQASQVGVVNVGAGSGSPFHVQGKVYLAGPYKGAPLSFAIITPAVAGPFDLGTVVVRAALYVDETTAQGTVKSDPIPTILQGIPLDVRSIAVDINRSGFTLNPTSCEEKVVSGEAVSPAGAVASLRSRFQVGGCKGLDFSPKLSLSLLGATKRVGHPALKALLTQPSGQANISRTSVILPPTEFIDPNHISNPCTRPQFAEGACPPGSVLGKARAFTPLLDKPLEGKVYFRANGGARKLPDVVADLNGQIHIVLVGILDSVHKKGSESSRLRTTFATVPDAPVSKFVLELKGGKKGTLVNSANLCKVPNVATVKMAAQNGRIRNSSQPIQTSCPR